MRKGARRLIVVVAGDDARSRRAMLVELQRAGFTAIGYPDARGALAYLALGERADALVTDVAMAGAVDGLGLARMASAGRPGLPVIYVSAKRPDQASMVPGGSFVAKPITQGAVAAAIAARLGGAA